MQPPPTTHADMEPESAAFPILDAEEMAAARDCGREETCAVGGSLFEPGQRPVDFFVVVSGTFEIVDTSGDEERLVVMHGPGSIVGDLNIFVGRPAVVSCRAIEDSTVLRFTVSELRRLLVRAAGLSEKWIAALLRRRELLDASGFEGLRVFGDGADIATLRVREFFHRNGVAHRWLDTADLAHTSALSALGTEPLKFPVIGWRNKVLLQNPTLHELAIRVGVQKEIPNEIFDTVIIGSGPSGLGAAVYAASEGLRTVVLDSIGPGGQAGSSSRIENYAGFPEGLSGRDLALRSYVQALKFGATFSAPVSVTRLGCLDGGLHEITTDTGEVVRTKTIIIATGVSYRALHVPGLRELWGAGVYFSATQVEALLCRERPVHVIGAGNSAGQAAMFLSKFTERVHLVLRGDNLRKSMSSYLAERVEVNPRITIRRGCELRGIEGTRTLERVLIEDNASGLTTVEDTGGLFIFIGATPCTGFLGDRICKDEKGFILTGPEAAANGTWPLANRAPCALETSCPGIFASGDCRSRTTKRVAFAVGDGALAVTCVHEYLGTYA